MTLKNLTVLAVLFATDLLASSRTKEDNTLTITDFNPEVQKAVENADVVIYENEARQRRVIVFNNDIEDEGAPFFEVLSDAPEANDIFPEDKGWKEGQP